MTDQAPLAAPRAASTRIDACRACAHPELEPVLDLGAMPLADRLLRVDQLADPEPRFRLAVVFCPACGLVQIDETVAPELLFADHYPYYSSFSDALLQHSAANVAELLGRRGLGADSLVVEVASNDGYLLRNYVERGVPVLGIDPAAGPAAAAEQVGVPTLVEFFGADLADQLAADGRRADVIHANNVLAHVADTNGVVRGLRLLLKDDGVAVLEVPYLRDLIDGVEFDTIYHEHLCYFSVLALDRLFRHHGLFLNDVHRLAIHGGSLRLFVAPREDVQASVSALCAEERALGMDRMTYYADFAERVRRTVRRLRDMVDELGESGARIGAYGAAAKGATLLNFANLGADRIEFVVDRNVHKQGKFLPGVHVPVSAPERLIDELPEYALLLAWNFRDEILAQQTGYRRRGGKFIVPVPEPEIV